MRRLTLVLRLVSLRRIYFQSEVLNYSFFFFSFEIFLFPVMLGVILLIVFILKKIGLHRQACCREDTSKVSEVKTLSF